MKTRYNKIKEKIGKLESELYQMAREKERRETEINEYIKRHKSLSFDGIETCDVLKLEKVYAYFDGKYPIECQGGLRCDNRGMSLCFWLDNDPDYLILHLTSTSENICFGGSTNWIVKAETLADKLAVLAQIKKDVLEILDGKENQK